MHTAQTSRNLPSKSKLYSLNISLKISQYIWSHKKENNGILYTTFNKFKHIAVFFGKQHRECMYCKTISAPHLINAATLPCKINRVRMKIKKNRNAERRRRENRGQQGRERGWVWVLGEGAALDPHQLGGLGSAVRRSPSRNRICCFFVLKYYILWQQI